MPLRVLPQLPPDKSDLLRVISGWYIFCLLNISRDEKRRDEMFDGALAELTVQIREWWEWHKENRL